MRNLLRVAIGAGLFSLTLQAATVAFTVSTVGVSGSGDTIFRYQYNVTGLALLANQELDLRFSPALYSNLTNAVAPAGFSTALFQPNNPPGAFGDFSAFTTTNMPNVTGPFSVDFIFRGAGTPGSQPFLINQYDAAGLFLRVVDSGTTVPAGGPNVPEPATYLLSMGGLLFAGIARFARRRQV